MSNGDTHEMAIPDDKWGEVKRQCEEFLAHPGEPSTISIEWCLSLIGDVAHLQQELHILRGDLFEAREVVTAENFAEMQQRAERAEHRNKALESADWMLMIDEMCCEWGPPEYRRTDDGEAWYWCFPGHDLPVADHLSELLIAASQLTAQKEQADAGK